MNTPAEVPLRRIAALFLRLGAIGFGGPAAHIALMHDELVSKRGWLSDERFAELVGVTNLIPGPNSSEIAIHAGYLFGGVAGGIVAGVCFALPATVLVTAAAAAYFASGGFAVRDDLFTGMQPVVVAAIAFALWRLRSSAKGRIHGGIAIVVFALTLAFSGWEPIWLVGAGAFSLIVSVRPSPAGEPGAVAAGFVVAGVIVAVAVGSGRELPALAWVCLKTGLLLFGGGYVLVPLLGPEVVAHGWLTRERFLDGIALGQATPGPIVTSAAFVGYGAAGVAGAVLATVAIYLPAFVAVLALTGPFLRAFRERPAVKAAVAGVTAAALGEIAAAGVTLGREALASPLRVAVGAGALIALVFRVPIWAALMAGAAIGVIAGVVG